MGNPYTVCVLMAVYRRPSLARQAVGCFVRQKLPAECRAILFVGDDGDTFESVSPETPKTVILRRYARRFSSLGAKYNAMRAEAAERFAPDAFALMDDDDIYLPRYLADHLAALSAAIAAGKPAWSKPGRIWSDYTGEWVQEDSAGRFHGSIAFTSVCRTQWPEAGGLDFDQRFMAGLARECGPPAEANQPGDGPGYAFRWHSHVWHAQHFAAAPDWYAAVGRAAGRPDAELLFPAFDSVTQAVYRRLWMEKGTKHDAQE